MAKVAAQAKLELTSLGLLIFWGTFQQCYRILRRPARHVLRARGDDTIGLRNEGVLIKANVAAIPSPPIPKLTSQDQNMHRSRGPSKNRIGMSRQRVLRDYWLNDHAWVRVLIPNFHKVDNEVYRANHPGYRRLRLARDLGVRSVLSLRGDRPTAPTLIEKAACERLGLELRFVALRTTRLPQATTLLDLIACLRDMPKPLLLHCKSGADRTGLAVTLYLHVLKGKPIAEARTALNWKYAHFSWSKAGIVHRMLDAYEGEHLHTGIRFEEWVSERYDREALSR